MSRYKKIIFLNNNEKRTNMGTLTLELKNNNIFGNIKIFGKILDGNYTLGIRTEKEIIKQNVSIRQNNYSFILSNNFNLDNNIGCVLLKTDNNEFEPIIWGSEKNDNYKSNIINSLRESIRKLSNNKKVSEATHTQQHPEKTMEPTPQVKNYQESFLTNTENVSLDNNIAYSPIHKNYQTNIDHIAQISLEEELIENKNEIAVASTAANLFETSDKEIEEIIDNNINKADLDIYNIEEGNHKFYDMISSQLKELFDRYPKEQNLSNLIDDSKWVKIDTDDDNKHYVVGIIYQENDIKYICYGVPGSYNISPPIEMRDYSQWLPTDINDPYNNGYWVMYQNADTGENIPIN